MARWARGEAEVEQLIAAGHLERVSGAQADGNPPAYHSWRSKVCGQRPAEVTMRSNEPSGPSSETGSAPSEPFEGAGMSWCP
jgi:hypothetical protein